MSLNCVFCKEVVANTELEEHICGHLKYYPHLCAVCDYKTSKIREIAEHRIDTGHAVVPDGDRNDYMQKILLDTCGDCILASEEIENVPNSASSHDSVAKIKHQKEKTAAGSAFGQKKNTPVARKSNIVQKKADTVTGRLNAGQPNALVVESDGLATRKRSLEEGAQNSDKESVSKSKKLSPPAQEDVLKIESEVGNITRLIRRGSPTTVCAKCKDTVTNIYQSRKEHVLEKHFSERKAAENDNKFATRYLPLCFRGQLVVNDYQCNVCGVEIKTQGLRRDHINKEHVLYYLDCPLNRCPYTSLSMAATLTHFRVSHNVIAANISGKEKEAFERNKLVYLGKLNPVLSLCFPYQVSKMAKDPEDSYDGVEEELALKTPPTAVKSLKIIADETKRAQNTEDTIISPFPVDDDVVITFDMKYQSRAFTKNGDLLHVADEKVIKQEDIEKTNSEKDVIGQNIAKGASKFNGKVELLSPKKETDRSSTKNVLIVKQEVPMNCDNGAASRTSGTKPSLLGPYPQNRSNATFKRHKG